MPIDEALVMLPAPEDIRKRFKDAGFEIAEASQSPEAFSVKKHGCICYLTRQPGSGWARSALLILSSADWNANSKIEATRSSGATQRRGFRSSLRVEEPACL